MAVDAGNTKELEMIGLLGSGSWATAIAKVLTEQPCHRLCWYVREPAIRQSLADSGRNTCFLPEVRFDMSRIVVCDNVQDVVRQCDVLFLAIPTAFIDGALRDVDNSLLDKCKIVSASKGFVPETDELVTEYLHHAKDIPLEQLAIISGPTHAEEVARERLTFITAASENLQLAEEVQQLLHCQYMQVFISDDMCGIQYAAALKNIYAIATGVCVGLGCGDNLTAVLVSYAMAEMKLFIETVQPDRIPSWSPSNMPPYIGDMLVTCYSQLSRNRTFGTMIGRGYTVRSAQLEMNMVAEGYYAVRSAEKVRQRIGLEMPILHAAYMVLYDGAKPEVLQRAWKIYKPI